jgi:hypothetical protein
MVEFFVEHQAATRSTHLLETYEPRLSVVDGRLQCYAFRHNIEIWKATVSDMASPNEVHDEPNLGLRTLYDGTQGHRQNLI